MSTTPHSNIHSYLSICTHNKLPPHHVAQKLGDGLPMAFIMDPTMVTFATQLLPLQTPILPFVGCVCPLCTRVRVCSTQEGGESDNAIICFVRVVKGFFLKACSKAQPFSHHQFTFQLCFKSLIHIKTHIHITTSGEPMDGCLFHQRNNLEKCQNKT